MALIDRRLASTCVAVPASVQAVDASKQVVDVKPLVQAYRTVDGVQKAYSLPVIPHCPVQWPGAGGFVFASSISVGDQVLCVFSDRALERWWSSGQEGDPGDPRIHHLSDAFVIPEVRANGRAIQGVPAGKAIIGKEGGPLISFGASDIRLGGDDATEPAVMGNQLATQLQGLCAALLAFATGLNSGTLIAQAGTLVTALGVPTPVPTNLFAKPYLSSLVKVK